MTPDIEHDSGRGEASDAAPARFGLLLVLLIGAYLLSALTEGRWISVLLVLLFTGAALLALGYGDFTAAGNPGRALAILEALTGQIFLLTLVASLVAQFRSPRARGAPRSPRR